MKSLLLLLAVLLSLGAHFSGRGPAPDLEPVHEGCRDENCLKVRLPGPVREARGAEDPGMRYRADFPPPGG